jgi:hypothetical protein
MEGFHNYNGINSEINITLISLIWIYECKTTETFIRVIYSHSIGRNLSAVSEESLSHVYHLDRKSNKEIHIQRQSTS